MAKAALIYLIGVPGAGKSTLLAAALQGCPAVEVQAEPGGFALTVYPPAVCQIGRVRKAFSGTDALSLSVQPQVVAWLPHAPFPVIVAEGDRLGNARFFEAARQVVALTVVLLDLDPDEAGARRAERGSSQDSIWLKGRASKVRALRPFVGLTLDAALPVEALAAQLLDQTALGRVRASRRN